MPDVRCGRGVNQVSRVKISDLELDAFTFCRRDEVGQTLAHWLGLRRPDIDDVIEALQGKLNRGEPTHEEEAFLAIRIEAD